MPSGPLVSDCVAFMPDGAIVLAAGAFDGALCSAGAPAAGPSLLMVPCALAKPAPAISAAAATDIIKRLVIEYLLTVFLARVDNEEGSTMFPNIRSSIALVS